jgi:2'-5' RNA ligase
LETVRSFIAIELTEEVQKKLGEIQNELKKADADVKWVNPCDIHLTLKFLGNVSLDLTKEISKIIDQLAKEQPHFELQIAQIGAFPKIEYPRVIWVGIEKGKEQTVQLAQTLEERLINLGFMKEKRSFKPHLTLGRVRSAHNRNQLKKLLQSLVFVPTTMLANTIVLFKSTLTPHGAIYEPLHEVKFK